MDESTRKRLLARLRRVAGQVEGIARMVEAERPFDDVLLQVASAQAALGEAGRLALRTHVETCIHEAVSAGKAATRRQKLDAVMEAFSRHGSLGES